MCMRGCCYTGTISSSGRFYLEFRRDLTGGRLPPPNTEVPFGVSVVPEELMVGRRRWVEADRNITFWREHNRGGHFAPMARPKEFVADIREFFRALR